MVSDGTEHIQRLMHVFIEGLAAGVYDNVDDIQQDAKEYLAMEKAVEKLSKWGMTSNVDDLVNVFDGLSNSLNKKREKLSEEQAWEKIKEMPKLGENDAK